MAKIGRRFRLTKAGKVERKPTLGPDVSAKLRQRPGGSKRVRVVKPAQIDLEDYLRRT